MPSAVEPCFQSIRDAIRSGRPGPGERLPSERTLAARFGVNRVTIREALNRLEAARLLRSRQGSGWTVQDYRALGGPELIACLADLSVEEERGQELAEDLLLIRRHMASAVLERLAARPPSATAVRDTVDSPSRRRTRREPSASRAAVRSHTPEGKKS